MNHKCPVCAAEMDGFQPVGAPAVDIIACAKCTSVLELDSSGQLIPITPETLEDNLLEVSQMNLHTKAMRDALADPLYQISHAELDEIDKSLVQGHGWMVGNLADPMIYKAHTQRDIKIDMVEDTGDFLVQLLTP